MPLRIGIVGLPNVGKSTLFNALTRSRSAQAANYPFCTIDPNVGVVEVPDSRLSKIAEIAQPKKVIPATVEFVDIAGLVKGASQGEGLGNKFLTHIREVNAICHVVRFFEGGDIIHVEGSVDPLRDRSTIDTELALSDLDGIRKRMDKLAGAARSGDKARTLELETAQKVEAALQEGKPASSVSLNDDESAIAEQFGLLTCKPVIFAVNVSEEQLAILTEAQAREKLQIPADSPVVIFSAKIEEDLQDLTPEEALQFLADLHVSSSGLDRLIQAAYRLLGYQTFFTAGPEEVRAWTMHAGSTAPQAAGVIHTDFERGFICSETIAYDDYIAHRGEQHAKVAGKMRTEGKQYVMKDGDVVHFRFHV